MWTNQKTLHPPQSDLTDNPDDIPDKEDETTQEGTEGSVLHGATEELSQDDLEKLRKELELSDDNENTVPGSTGSGTKLVKGATCPQGCTQERTLEDAIWKESASEFLIVDDSVLNLPDCSLSIKSLSDREIEIQLDPRNNELRSNQESAQESTEPTLIDETGNVVTTESDNKEQEEPHGEMDVEHTELVKPKMKIGTGKQ